MALHINRNAIPFAHQLIEAGARARSTRWETTAPSLAQAERYRREQGDEAFANWHLAYDTDPGEAARCQFPIGDFTRVHENAVRAARRYGELHNVPELVEAADEILDLFDRMNAC
ncbi:MAG: hypothetical protein SF162_15885 [bacterium]|nr:hypothetical protein [bacterium]